jgi:hypothetical protein
MFKRHNRYLGSKLELAEPVLLENASNAEEGSGSHDMS